MLGQAFEAFFKATLTVGTFSFLLSWWALKHEYFGKAGTLKDLERNVKRHTEARKKKKKAEKLEKKARKKSKAGTDELLTGATLDPETELFESRHRSINPVHRKWLAFGGGFYGVLALLTYVVIELYEIRDFFVQFHGLLDFLNEITLGLLIGFLVNSILNFIWAITWPVYWLERIPANFAWIWLVAAYLGYWLGARLAFWYPPQSAAEEE